MRLPFITARLAALFLAYIACSAQTPAASATAPPAASVMIVGVAHLVAKNDVHNSTFTDSPLSAARQSQIREVVERLARFAGIDHVHCEPRWMQDAGIRLQVGPLDARGLRDFLPGGEAHVRLYELTQGRSLAANALRAMRRTIGSPKRK